MGDQEGHWYLARLLPYRTEEDRIGGVVLTFVDISTRKEVELALRTSEERYRRLFNSIDEGFCVLELIFNNAYEFPIVVLPISSNVTRSVALAMSWKYSRTFGYRASSPSVPIRKPKNCSGV